MCTRVCACMCVCLTMSMYQLDSTFTYTHCFHANGCKWAVLKGWVHTAGLHNKVPSCIGETNSQLKFHSVKCFPQSPDPTRSKSCLSSKTHNLQALSPFRHLEAHTQWPPSHGHPPSRCVGWASSASNGIICKNNGFTICLWVSLKSLCPLHTELATYKVTAWILKAKKFQMQFSNTFKCKDGGINDWLKTSASFANEAAPAPHSRWPIFDLKLAVRRAGLQRTATHRWIPSEISLQWVWSIMENIRSDNIKIHIYIY